MDVIFDNKESLETEFKTFTENRVKFSLKRLVWLVRKIKVKFSLVSNAKNTCNQHCRIELQTFDHRLIEVSITARDRRATLEMGLKKVYKHVQKAFNKSQKYGRLSKYVYA
jgi:hypothetical protein